MRRRCVSTDLRRIPTLRHPRTAMNAAAMRIKFVTGDDRLQKVQPSGTEGFLIDRTYTQPGPIRSWHPLTQFVWLQM